jgi:hypothetical protein
MMPVSKDQLEETPNERIIRMATAYQTSRALYVAVELGLFGHLSDGDKSVQELAEAADCNPAALTRLLSMLAAFDILNRLENGRFALTAAGDLLCSDASDGLRAVVLMYGSPNFLVPGIDCATAFGLANPRSAILLARNIHLNCWPVNRNSPAL